MSDLRSGNVEYMLLRIIAEHNDPIGAGFLADMLQGEDGSAVSEATIGRYLRKFEKQGFLKSEKYDGRSRGRIITEKGRARVRALAGEKRQAEAILDTIEIFNNGFGEQLRNVLVTREIIEPEVAALAAQNASDENIEALRRIVEEAAQLTEMGKSMAATDAPFHIEIAKASGNPVLEAVMKMIRTDRDYSPEIESMINASSLNNPSDHASIYKAIKEHDAEKARYIMKQHIHNLVVKCDYYENKDHKSSGAEPAKTAKPKDTAK